MNIQDKEILVEELEEHIMQVRDATFKNPFFFMPRERVGLAIVASAETFEKISWVSENNKLSNEVTLILEPS